MSALVRVASLAAVALIGLPLLAAPAPAQKAQLSSEWFSDHHNGYRLKHPAEWQIAPVQPEESRFGIVAQMKGPDMATRIGNQSYDFVPRLIIMKFEAAQVVTEEQEEGGLRERVDESSGKRRTVADFMQRIARGLRDFKEGEIKPFEHKDFPAQLQTFTAFDGNVDVHYDTYTYRMDDFDIALIYELPAEHLDKWQRVFVGSAKSFERIERRAAVTVTDPGDYDQILAAARDETSRTPGWRVVEVPSKRYVIKTSTTNERFLKTVVERLEASRDLFERDFPPSAPIEHVSIVRVCGTLEEFHEYGKTGGGVAGWFNPRTTELVIVDFKDYNRNMTYAVMTHEAFHQYCHFLFGQSEAHRWFDEGHGDYYGGFEFQGRKAICKAKMPPGLERLSGIREMLRENTYAPIGKHVRMDHSSWQTQGPSNVSCYEQSWSIIYFLRRGMEGEVPKRLWRPEYANIIPEYMRVLHEEYQKAYEEARAQRQRDAETSGEPLAEEEDEEGGRAWISVDTRDKIWDQATTASWGQIDLDEFEKHWKEYVLKELKD